MRNQIEFIDNRDHLPLNYPLIGEFLEREFDKIKETDLSENKLLKIKNELLAYYIKKGEALFSSLDNSLSFIDLFSGAGGLSVGLEYQGLLPVVAVDKDVCSLETYLFNRPFMDKAQIINKKIEEIDISNLPKVPIVVGGPPCQGFSNANKQRKINDERNKLYKFYVNVVEQVNPTVFLMENVSGILKYIDQIKTDFSNIGYDVFYSVLNTKDFGFPQNRARAFIIGYPKKYKKLDTELRSTWDRVVNPNQIKEFQNFTLWDAIGDLPPLEAKTKNNATFVEKNVWGYQFSNLTYKKSHYSKLINDSYECSFVLNHKTKYNNSRDINIYQEIPEGGKISDVPHLDPYKNREHIFKDKFNKLSRDNISKTMTAHMYYDCHMYIHPTQARGLTPREAARIQGFPDDYLFLGAPNEWYRQIGNAVSPLIARHLGEGLKQIVNVINGGRVEH